MNKDVSIDTLNDKVQAIKDKIKNRYYLARSLGFTGTESALLQNYSEENIRKLAEERKQGEVKDGSNH